MPIKNQSRETAAYSEQTLAVIGIEESSSGILSITLSDHTRVYTRSQYLSAERDKLTSGYPLDGIHLDALYYANRQFLAECKAISLLNYAENSRFMLEQKLIKKGFSRAEISAPLDYLAQNNILSDERFAKTWLRSRLKYHAESKSVLTARLMTRGISSSLAKKVINETMNDSSELELCKKAVEKQIRKNASQDKIFSRLQAAGFSYTTIKKALSDD